VEVFRCTDCETPFHHECAEKHFAAHKDPPCIYCTSQPDDGTPCPCHHAPCVHDTNQARKERDELAVLVGAARAAMPEYLRGEADLVFAVKVLACHYAGALDTASAFAASLREAHAALKAGLGGHTHSEIVWEVADAAEPTPHGLSADRGRRDMSQHDEHCPCHSAGYGLEHCICVPKPTTTCSCGCHGLGCGRCFVCEKTRCAAPDESRTCAP
jgi:hypothetical protein